MPTTLPPLDLHDALLDHADELCAAISGLRRLEVGLWEGGVRVALRLVGGTVVLKLSPPDEGQKSYARTPSTKAALELRTGDILLPRMERVVRAVLAWIEHIDQGRLVLRKHAPDFDVDDTAPDAAPAVPGAAEREAEVALGPVHLDDLQVACHADQRAALSGWALDDELLVLLGPRDDLPDADVRAARCALIDEAAAAGVRRAALAGPDVPGHPHLPDVLARLRAGGFDEVAVEVPDGAAARVPALVAAGVTALVARGDTPGALALAAASAAAGRPLVAWLPATEAVIADLPARVDALRAAGARVLLVPAHIAGAPSDANPLDLSDAADACEVALAGLPVCFAPSRPHVPSASPLWRLGEDGTRYGVVCRHCTARAQCPGVTPDHLARWQTRGMIPVLDL